MYQTIPQTLTTFQVAKLLQVTDQTCRNWCAAGKIEGAFQLPGGGWRIPDDSPTLRPAERKPWEPPTTEEILDKLRCRKGKQ